MQLIRYDGWPVALAGTDGVVFHPALLDLAERDEAHPLVRFTCAMALHAFEVGTGIEEGPLDQRRVERFARELLMPAELFRAGSEAPDAELAERFGVPVEQVPERRFELAALP
jgi:Zn-dependent peptidase ImmA (M78 family)